MAEEQNTENSKFYRNPFLYVFINAIIVLVMYALGFYILMNTILTTKILLFILILFVLLPLSGLFTSESIKIGIIGVSILLTNGLSIYMFLKDHSGSVE